MKIKKTRLWVGIACIVLSAIISFIVLPFAIRSAADYTGKYSTDDSFAYPAYRIVRINCPVDVEVVNSKGTKVAQIINDVPQKVFRSSVVSALSEGEKLIYLPTDEEFAITITATDNGIMTYAVNKFSYDSGRISRAVNYYDVPLSTGKTFEAILPAVSTTHIGNGSTVEYTLSDGNNIIPANDDFKGDEVTNACFKIKVTSEDSAKGIAYGGGTYLKGNAVIATAVANEDYEFGGWYADDKKLSSDPEYKFIVLDELSLKAKFVEANNPTHPTGSTLWLVPFSFLVLGLGATAFWGFYKKKTRRK